jgi:hypothetical protein
VGIEEKSCVLNGGSSGGEEEYTSKGNEVNAIVTSIAKCTDVPFIQHSPRFLDNSCTLEKKSGEYEFVNCIRSCRQLCVAVSTKFVI